MMMYVVDTVSQNAVIYFLSRFPYQSTVMLQLPLQNRHWPNRVNNCERADLVVSRARFFMSISTGAAYRNVLRNSKYA